MSDTLGHDAHNHPGWNADQILADGCGECTRRSESKDRGIADLDAERFARAWVRAAAWARDDPDLSHLSRAEVPLLAALWAVQVKLEERGLPIGVVPTGDLIAYLQADGS